ncbi:MAG TPA: hypothetical protein VFL85_00745 [Candidatus Saccharimonadales bacterium]|nr:hypothetical protein [Candidatus Saccharimonadales bacterium]
MNERFNLGNILSKNKPLVVAGAGLVAVGAVASCSTGKATPTHAVDVCSRIINKASFTYTEYDWARKLWDGQSQQKTVVDYKYATANGQVIDVHSMDDYIRVKVGDQHCDTYYVEDGRTPDVTTPTPASTPTHGEKCGIVQQAEILNKTGIAASNLLGDGEWRTNMKVYPVLTTQELGSVVVDENKYVLHPVGTVACFDQTELSAQ